MLQIVAIALVLIVLFSSRQAQAAIGIATNGRRFGLKNDTPFFQTIMTESTARGLDPCLVAGIIQVESSFNPDAANPSDPSLGLMQITPIALKDTQQRGNISPTVTFESLRNPVTNIEVGTEFLRILRDLHNIQFPDEVDAFNAGPDLNPRVPDYVRKVKAAMRQLCA